IDGQERTLSRRVWSSLGSLPRAVAEDKQRQLFQHTAGDLGLVMLPAQLRLDQCDLPGMRDAIFEKLEGTGLLVCDGPSRVEELSGRMRALADDGCVVIVASRDQVQSAAAIVEAMGSLASQVIRIVTVEDEATAVQPGAPMMVA